MDLIIKRCVFTDEWFKPQPADSLTTRFLGILIRLYFPPAPAPTHEFKNYVLGFRFEATPRELELIQANSLFGHPALKLREGEPPITFAEILGPEFVPEVNPSQAALFGIESKLRQTAIAWTHFFRSIDDAR